ncbi:MAG: SBBP repeat-containing protein [Candidatus Aminicenantes bacterium]|nr:SBBP repeat-containing protein [Candidatus Aminicenantes bacterium]
MKRVILSFFMVFVVFALFAGFTQQPKIKNAQVWQWNDGIANTFLGGRDCDSGMGIALDTKGNIYVTGWTDIITGSLIKLFDTEYHDVFVAKLNPLGDLKWLTFLDGDIPQDIIIDGMGNIYIAGYTFLAKLDSKGILKWKKNLPAGAYGEGIAINSIGEIFVTGKSECTWGYPVNLFNGDVDAFLAKFDYKGELKWNTFLEGVVEILAMT